MEAQDWTERSYREAAALVATAPQAPTVEKYDALVELLAVAYRKGALDGMKRAQEIIDQVKP